jgi:long-subunit fatty acid transport protein
MTSPRLVIPIVALIACLPRIAQAGGTEFPADGTRGLGRGGARAARADDPTIMTRNPAALALLWDDQAVFGAHLLLTDACMQPTGGYGWGIQGNRALSLGDGPVYPLAGEGDTDLKGKPLDGFIDDPYPRICSQGAAPFLPMIALSMKLTDDLGVGLGFFPPDAASLYQWGNRDGTVDTTDGKRPNPLRYYRSHQNVSYFSLLAAAGYRLAPWISVGAGLQWMMVIYEAATWSTPISALDPEADVRGDLFGRDLFVPGLIGSVQIQPIDALDIVVGFKWSDRVKSNVKLDITTGAFGTGEVFRFNDASTGQVATVGSSIPTTTPNQPGRVDSPPVWAPQLTLALRYADRLVPKPKDQRAAHEAAGGTVEDHMQTERWDVEVDGIYYFTSVYDRAQYTTRDAMLKLRSIDANGIVSEIPASPGDCLKRDPMTNNCVGNRLVKTDLGGKNQFTVRGGGDYNVLPGLLALRAGLSYEQRGQDPSMLNVLNYMLSRTGVHAGLTVRVAGKTDVSFAYAHFFQENVELQVYDGQSVSSYPPQYRNATYHFRPGRGVTDAMGNGASLGGFAGTAGVEVPNGDESYPVGPYFINAGKYFYHLDVVSASVTQHF